MTPFPASQTTDQFIVMRIGARRCALPRAAVRELLPLPRLWRPPGLPRPLAGFLNLAGEAVPVLELGRLFGLASAAGAEDALYRHIVLTGRDGEALLALLVDRVLDVVRLPPERLRPVPPEMTLNGCATAGIETPEGIVPLLALDRILMAQEAQALAALREAASARLAEWDLRG